MIDKRLFQLASGKPLVRIVALRLVQLAAGIVSWITIAQGLAVYFVEGTLPWLWQLVGIVAVCWMLKAALQLLLEKDIHEASAELRLDLREQVLQKAAALGDHKGQLSATTLTQLAVDGIQQVEIYFSRFLPQLFYCLLASLLIFLVLLQFAWQPAVVLLIGIPLIPVVIMLVMRIAKKILSSYWGRYTDLGARFYENLQGFGTIKAFGLETQKEAAMVREAEDFRQVTMRLLSMQLNSITVMDVISYGGAGLGIGVALQSWLSGRLSLAGMILFLFLSAEVFIPMRQLGSLFHVAMNGISACGRLFDYLELPEVSAGTQILAGPVEQVTARQLSFAYDEVAELQQVSLELRKGELTALVGKSGSGKSTLAKVLLGDLSGYQGSLMWDDRELTDLAEEQRRHSAVLVNNQAYLYPTTIAENLRLARPQATEEELRSALAAVSLAAEVQQMPAGLNTPLQENGSNLSGGQRQRLLLAQGLLKDGEFYLLDEITSGVDHESEEQILSAIQNLAQEKIVLFISHRLYNVLEAQQVVVLADGQIAQKGTPAELLATEGFFKEYFQQEATILGGGGDE